LYWIVIVRKSISFPKEVEDRLIEYRNSRKSEVGKMMPRSTAIAELLRFALTNLEPPKPIEERIDDAGRDCGSSDGSSDGLPVFGDFLVRENKVSQENRPN
jgi:hypothetical protein